MRGWRSGAGILKIAKRLGTGTAQPPLRRAPSSVKASPALGGRRASTDPHPKLVAVNVIQVGVVIAKPEILGTIPTRTRTRLSGSRCSNQQYQIMAIKSEVLALVQYHVTDPICMDRPRVAS